MKYVLVFVFILAGIHAYSQTCTGGLGDPITNITFGAGANFGSPLAAGITNLAYSANQCINDGEYTIVHSVNGCWSGTWLNLNTDHTGDPNGYFMLINASYNPSDFYVQTVSGLCAATTYQFAAWVLNMSAQPGQILPNITLSIEKTDGTLLASIHTGDVPQTNSANWTQYGFYFTTPPGVSTVVLRMTNNAPGGNGNDLALDDITFRPAGPPISITMNGLASDSTSICAGSSVAQLLQATVGNCYSSPTYQWQVSTDNGQGWNDIPGAVTQSYSALPVTAGTYTYRLATAQSGNIGISSCKVASDPTTIVVIKIPSPAVNISATSDNICAGSPATLTAQPTDAGNSPLYQWMVNGGVVSTAGPTYTSSSFADADQISCLMTSNASCVLSPTAASNIISMTVTPIVVSSVTIGASATTICSDSLVRFTAMPTNGGSNPAYQWMINGQPIGTDTPVYSSATLQDGDLVSVAMLGSLYCSVQEISNTLPITVYPLPEITMPPDTILAAGSSIRLLPLVTGQAPLSLQWTPSDWLDLPGSLDPMASPITTTTYQLTVTTSNGCTTTGKEKIGVYYDLLMPGAFSPNGDGRNDVFRIPPSVPVSILQFAVYNRWGQLVFITSNSSAGWDGRLDGKPQPTGVYVWIIEYINPLTKKTTRKNGTVTLVQ